MHLSFNNKQSTKVLVTAADSPSTHQEVLCRARIFGSARNPAIGTRATTRHLRHDAKTQHRNAVSGVNERCKGNALRCFAFTL